MPQTASLRFITGSQAGRVFWLTEPREVKIGRAASCDIQICEDLISRQHAKLRIGASVTLEDCGSHNGTYVNGNRVESVDLRPGDRIVIGTSVAQIDYEGPQGYEPAQSSASMSMFGQLREFALPDVLQLLAASRKSGTLALDDDGHAGQIDIVEGAVVDCRVGGMRASPLKALTRLLGWQRGAFALEPLRAPRARSEPLHGSTQGALMEAMRHLDEVPRVVEGLGGYEAVVRLGAVSAPAPEGTRRELLQLLDVRNCSVRECLDSSTAPDLEVAQALADLSTAGAVCIERRGGPPRAAVAVAPKPPADESDPFADFEL